MALIQSTAIPSGATDYELEQSLKFNDDDSAYLSWTPSSAGNRRTWTASAWVKRSKLSSQQYIWACTHTDDAIDLGSYFGSNDRLYVTDGIQGGGVLQTTQVFRDTSAWLHIVWALDTTQSTVNNRIKIYVNGVQVTDFANNAISSGISQNEEMAWMSADKEHRIGRRPLNNSAYLDGYITEFNFVDGLVKAPADFGETGDYGEWKPIEYSGTYGTNGFYLPFKQDYTVEGFSTVLYKGTSAAQYIGGTGFKPDMLWIKRRFDGTSSHGLYDSIRGTESLLTPNSSAAEAGGTNSTEDLASFDTDGFSLGGDGGNAHGRVNTSGKNYVAWNWDMGGSNASNTNGSINSTVRANPTYGQSIVSYTGTGANATVGHGLSSAPEFMIVKTRSHVGDWMVYAGDNTDFLKLNETNATEDLATVWNDTSPTNSVFSLGSNGDVNTNGRTYVAYAFHSVTGYSKFGTYSGTGSSGNAITTGFKPAFVMTKRTNGTEDWFMFDNTRNPTNPVNLRLKANTSDADGAYTYVNFTDTGFTWLATGTGQNGSGDTYIYMAFADKREYAYWLDQSGNNNDWTSNNLTESDISVDSPTNNFATMNPNATGSHTEPDTNTYTLQEGNLYSKWTGIASAKSYATIAPTDGKWYWEFFIMTQAETSRSYVGLCEFEDCDINGTGQSGDSNYHIGVGNYSRLQAYGNEFDGVYPVPAQYDVYSIAIDWSASPSKFWFRINGGAWQGGGNPATGATPTKSYAKTVANASMMPYHGSGSGSSSNVSEIIFNFGQDSSFAGNKTAQGNQDGNDIGDFYYTPPTGYLALCTKNLPDVAVTPSEHFNTVLYSGTGSTQTITGVGFQPDLTWTAERTETSANHWFDAVRGYNKGFYTNLDNAESNQSNMAVASDGITVGSSGGFNENSQNYAMWNWKANGSGSSNTNGSINSTVSANTDAGFSIISYHGNATAGATIGHGLSKAPELVICKDREAANGWGVGAFNENNTKALYLSSYGAFDTNNYWNSTNPSATLITLGVSGATNANNEMMAYAWHSVDGYSKVGSYTGNANADGTFVYTGFRPMWVMVKRTTSNHDWDIYDTKRSTFNPMDDRLRANDSSVEADGGDIDFTSNGFKLRQTGNGNGSGDYIYLCFAETPFKNSNAR